MLEKMFTTKMSADKKKLQSRFSKIRSKNGKLSKVIGGILFGIIIIAIICVGVMIAVNDTKDYRMTDEEFSDYINRPIGSIMADLDYVDDEKLVFHYLEGFFVVDQQSYEIRHKINLSKLNIAGHTQGDSFTVFKVDKDGEFAYLTNEGLHDDRVAKYDNYIINLKTGEVKIGNAPGGTEFFTNYTDTLTEVENPYGWYSDKCIVNGDKGVYYLTTQNGFIASIQLVYLDHKSYDNSLFKYVFKDDYVSKIEKKLNIIEERVLKKDEEILPNSGFQWEVNGDKVEKIFDKLSETRNLKHFAVEKDGNYDVRMYDVWDNATDENNLMIFIFDNYKTELVFFEKITLDEQKYFVNFMKYPEMPAVEFYPQDIKKITHAEVVVNDAVYPIIVRDNLETLENMLSTAKIMKGGSGCPFTATLIITKENGDKGTITLATDDCAVFKTGNTYYDYSDGYSSELFGLFGLTTEEIIDMTAKR